jgi:hypothetical protein
VGGDRDRLLQNMQGNLFDLTQRIRMVQMEDMLEAMQRKVVSVPRAWEQLFQCLANTIICDQGTHSVPQA